MLPARCYIYEGTAPDRSSLRVDLKQHFPKGGRTQLAVRELKGGPDQSNYRGQKWCLCRRNIKGAHSAVERRLLYSLYEQRGYHTSPRIHLTKKGKGDIGLLTRER